MDYIQDIAPYLVTQQRREALAERVAQAFTAAFLEGCIVTEICKW